MSQDFTFYKGDTNFTKYEFDASKTLNKVREDLISKGFMSDSESSNYRFINYQNTDLKYEDMVIGVGSEKFVPLMGIEGVGSQIYLTDVTKEKGTDLLGFNTDWFFDRHMSAQIRLNNEASDNNGKFQPLMLTNVKTANPNIPGAAFDNVVVCQKDSIIEFSLSSWGAAGYGYKIKSEAGTPINERNLYRTFDGCPSGGNYGRSTLRRYFSNDESINKQTIRVVATESLAVGDKTLQYMKFTARTWKVTSYKRGDKQYTCNLSIPVPGATGRAAEGGGAASPNGQLANAPTGTTVVPGETIQPGTTVPSGQQSSQDFGTIHSIVQDDGPNGIIGEVIFYIFVFKTEQDAKDVITGVNQINPNLWK